jgi:long-subunit fatty acid transport protein
MKLARLALVTLILLGTASVSAQTATDLDDFANQYEYYNFNFFGGGARAAGMGNAYLAVSDGTYGISWNPAGIYTIEDPVMGMAYGSLIPRGSGSGLVMSLSPEPLDVDHGGSLGSISSLTFAAPLRIKGHQFVGSAGYTRNFTQYTEFGGTHQAYDTLYVQAEFGIQRKDSSFNTYEFNNQLEGGLYALNLGFGTRFYQDISFGASVNVYSGSTVRERFLTIYKDDYPLPRDQRGVSYEEHTVRDTAKFSGVNFTVGFKYNGDKWNAGLLVQTPFTLVANREVDSVRITTTRGTDGEFRVDAAKTDTLYRIDEKTKYEIPLRFGLGTSYKPSEKWLLAADLEYQPFSGKQVLVLDSLYLDPGGDNEEFFTEIDPNWNNVLKLRFGAEYLAEADFGTIPLRFGFGYNPLPAPSIDENQETSTSVDMNFSLGAGLHWEHIYLDFAYTYSSMDREVYRVGQQFENQTDYPVTGTIENRHHQIQFAFTGYF